MADQPTGDGSLRQLPASTTVDMYPTEKTHGLIDTSMLSRLGFPSEFPYEFNSHTFSPAFTSPGDSTETEDESTDEEEDFFAGLTRRLALSTQRSPPPTFSNDRIEEKLQAVCTSPQSTLSGLGSWSVGAIESRNGTFSHVPSPPKKTFGQDDTLDVISAVGRQVERMQMNSTEPLFRRPDSNPNPLQYSAPSPDNASPHDVKAQNAAFYSEQRFQQFYNQSNHRSQIFRNEIDAKHLFYADWVWYKNSSNHQSKSKFTQAEQQIPREVFGVIGCGRPATWKRSIPPRHQTSYAMRSAYPVGSASKPPSAGTGVFLPRRYINPSEFRKKSGGLTIDSSLKAVLPQNPNFDELNDHTQLHARPCHVTYELPAQCGSLRPVPAECLNKERSLPRGWRY